MKRTLLLAILLLALALRVYALGGQSLWYDEAVTARVASQGLGELTRWTADDIQPPLYYYVMAGWTRSAGNGEWALRYPSVFFSVLTVALIWSSGRRLLGGTAAMFAALLAAVSALYVYYGQEARMYALLTFLGLLAGYALLRAWSSRDRQAGWWAVFVLASAAMLYTHYFGAFLLLAYALCALVAVLAGMSREDQVRRSAAGKQALRAVLAFLAIVVLYLPWLPAMLNRYRADVSYWQGPLKLGEALRHLAISFVGGAPETMLEADGVRWGFVAAGALLVALVPAVIGRRPSLERGSAERGGRQPRAPSWPFLVLLCLLVVPIVLVLVLVSRTPKFNSRYLMLVSPAYMLLIAGLVDRLWQRRRLFTRIPAALLYIAVLAPTLAGTFNWFTSPVYAKAQWREAAAYVREHIGDGEAVVLVSGHAEPAWTYYAPDLAPTRLPPIDILDVNAVLGFEDARRLGEGLAGKNGAWLVTWQDDIVDPMQIVPLLLDRAGQEEAVVDRFWHVGVRHWRLAGGASYPPEPHPQHADGANFDHKVALLGWDDPSGGQLGVYWRTLNTLTEDYRVSLVVEDAAGNVVGRWDGRPAGYDYPAYRWQPGKTVYGRYPLPLPAEAGPGPYFVSLAVYAQAAPDGLDLRDVADNPAGKRVRLGPFSVEK